MFPNKAVGKDQKVAKVTAWIYFAALSNIDHDRPGGHNTVPQRTLVMI